MRFDLISIFPEFFTGPLEHGIVRKAREGGLIEIHVQDLRVFTKDRHRTVDDRPFGGGEGMVLKPEPLFEAVESLLGASVGEAPKQGAAVRAIGTNHFYLWEIRGCRRARGGAFGDRGNIDWRFRAERRGAAGNDGSGCGHTLVAGGAGEGGWRAERILRGVGALRMGIAW